MEFIEVEIVLELHARALSCHCECLAMNAANMFAVCDGTPVPHNQGEYQAVMLKWGLVDDKGQPTFIK